MNLRNNNIIICVCFYCIFLSWCACVRACVLRHILTLYPRLASNLLCRLCCAQTQSSSSSSSSWVSGLVIHHHTCLSCVCLYCLIIQIFHLTVTDTRDYESLPAFSGFHMIWSSLKKNDLGTGEVATQFRALIAFPEDSASTPSPHMVSHNPL